MHRQILLIRDILIYLLLCCRSKVVVRKSLKRNEQQLAKGVQMEGVPQIPIGQNMRMPVNANAANVPPQSFVPQTAVHGNDTMQGQTLFEGMMQRNSE